MKRPMKERVSDFMAGKGFYIVLLLCVAALGVSGYYLFSGMEDPVQTVSGPAKVTVTAAPSAMAVPPSTATPRPAATARPTATAAPKTTPAATADSCPCHRHRLGVYLAGEGRGPAGIFRRDSGL